MVKADRKKRPAVRTVKEGEPQQIDGVIVIVRRKRRHGGQYRVEVHPVPIDNGGAEPQ